MNNLEMSSVSTISHKVRLLPQCFFVNDVIIGIEPLERKLVNNDTRLNVLYCK